MSASHIHARLTDRTSWLVPDPALADAAEKEAIDDLSRRHPGKPQIIRRIDACRGVVQVKR